ncbi:MAG: hypothetical protein ACI9MC_003378 [Kiritimatiellia bacterium]|jgi:hypothetical protein
MTGTVPTLIVVGVYLFMGVLVAALLIRREHPPSTAAAALIVWPFLLPLLRAVTSKETTGPCSERIDHVFDALLQTLEDPASDDVPWAAQALELRATLHRADTRLAFVDRVLHNPGGVPGVQRMTDSLREARQHAAAEIDAVLTAVAQLRLQVGLLTLAGDVLPAQERLEELMGRANALLEVHDVGYVSANV